MKIFVLILLALTMSTTEGHLIDSQLSNVHQKLQEFYNLNDSMQANEKVIRDHSTKLSDALSRDWSDVDKKSVAKEMLQLWEGSSILNESDTMGILKTSRFKIELASYLGMATDRCLIEYDKDVLRYYVLSHLENDDPRVRIAAIRSLGFVGNNQDIEYLYRVVEGQSEGWSKHAAKSLELIGTDESLKALNDLQKSVSDSELLEFIESITSSST